MNNKENRIKIPNHLWIVGILYIIIYFIGMYDFIMVQINNTVYLNSLSLPGDVIEYFSNYPIFLKILWGVNVFSGLLGAVYLLLRRKISIILSFLAVSSKIILDIVTFSFMNRLQVFGFRASIIDILINLITFIFLLYSINIKRRGILN